MKTLNLQYTTSLHVRTPFVKFFCYNFIRFCQREICVEDISYFTILVPSVQFWSQFTPFYSEQHVAGYKICIQI